MPEDVDPRLGRRLIAESRLRRNELRIERAISKALDVHQKRAMAALRSQHSLTAAVPPDAFDTTGWDATVLREVQPVIEDVLQGIATGVFSFLDLSPEIRAQILGALDIDAVAADFTERVKTIGPSTADRVMSELSVGIGQGEGIPQLSKRIRESFGVAESHAARIARTETHGAAEATTYKSAGAIARAGFALTKTWLATSDRHTRPTHAAADGQTVRLDQPFQVGGALLDYPGGDGPAEEVINCRCSTIFNTTK